MKNENNTIEQYAINAHASTNHMYDTYLPYEFHLRMVVKVAGDFKHLIPQYKEQDVFMGCWLHDTIEDARKSYADIEHIAGKPVAEIVRACTNYTRGRNRAERMPDECYKDLIETPNARFVKLCDRIANVQYSKMTGSSMFQKYKSEHAHFVSMLKTNSDNLIPMWAYLNELFNSTP